ncbi:hypothetical protein M409DRAFT_65803 [Zasmidium cellare ATCC 36951]|uniref:LIP-domain-containing protein n=1 Tax=Zasmidium cellare ATCC 36951 TaxID=1080233 RepID=A0A6A6CQC4_ZASCE|nr:uncharacterized protein M409DRAFT_65803 [Zasmidium cellare ATCC 36951]KAF2167666.1 hypothetical protein M409DRAFT_65803 [Zasmidium cellare ATCC 36951]
MTPSFPWALALLTRLVWAAAIDQSAPVPPSKDPWYTAPTGFESAHPGQILRVRNAIGNLTDLYSNSSAAYNILFRTTNSHYQPAWAVTTVFVPKTFNSSQFLSYQTPYDTADLDASPSYALYGSDYTSVSPGSIGFEIQTSLSKGWYVGVPDYEGPLASFALGVTEGHATLDSIRASLTLLEGWGLSRNPKVALWGYSNGAQTSEFALELQVQYAPELKIAGAALGGLPNNLYTVAKYTASGTLYAALLPGGLLGITTQNPEARLYLLSQLSPSGQYNASTFLKALNLSQYEAIPFYAFQDIFKYFKDGSAILQDPRLQTIFYAETIAGYHGTPQVPMYIYKAVHDDVGPINETDELVARYCNVGVNIQYEKNTLGKHLDETAGGEEGAFSFLSSVLGGSYNHTGCTTRYVSINATVAI